MSLIDGRVLVIRCSAYYPFTRLGFDGCYDL